MMELLEANWWLIVIALVIGVVIAWWIFAANRKTRVTRESARDVLDEGAQPARRNQALIDAPKGSPLAPPPPSVAEPEPRPEPAEPAPAAAPEPAPSPPAPEPVVPEAEPKPEPAPPAPEPVPEPEPAAPTPEPAPEPAPAAGDDLTRIKGLGPKLEKLFQGLGIASFGQIAALTEADIDRIDPQLGAFAGRIRRDAFVEQAKFLAAGDIAGFEARFGAL